MQRQREIQHHHLLLRQKSVRPSAAFLMVLSMCGRVGVPPAMRFHPFAHVLCPRATQPFKPPTARGCALPLGLECAAPTRRAPTPRDCTEFTKVHCFPQRVRVTSSALRAAASPSRNRCADERHFVALEAFLVSERFEALAAALATAIAVGELLPQLGYRTETPALSGRG